MIDRRILLASVATLFGLAAFRWLRASPAQAAEKPARRRVHLWPVFQGAGGLVLAWFVFYVIGRMLLALPDSFHDGSLWESGMFDTSDSGDE